MKFANRRLTLEYLSELKKWPISLLMPFYYRMRFSSRGYDFLNVNARNKFEAERMDLDAEEQAAVKSLKTDGINISNIENLIPNVTLDEIRTRAIYLSSGKSA